MLLQAMVQHISTPMRFGKYFVKRVSAGNKLTCETSMSGNYWTLSIA